MNRNQVLFVFAALTVVFCLLLRFNSEITGASLRLSQYDSAKARKYIQAVSGIPTRDVIRNRYELLSTLEPTAAEDGYGYSITVRVSDKNLFSESKGLLSQRRKDPHRSLRHKGRVWEYPAALGIFHQSQPVAQGIVGLRAHGKLRPASREEFYKEKCQTSGRDFRIYNRSTVQPIILPQEFLRGQSPRLFHALTVRRKNAERNFIAFSIAREIGALVPDFELVHFDINDQGLCTALVIEHANYKQVRRMINPSGPFNRFKDPHFVSEEYYKLLPWLDTRPSYQEIQERIDIDSFTTNMLSIWYLGNRDWVQGVAGYSPKSGKWVWAIWDLDTTIRPFEFSEDFYPNINRHQSPRSRLLSLLLEYPEYRNYIRTNHLENILAKLSPEFYSELFKQLKLISPDFRSAANFEELLAKRNRRFHWEVDRLLKSFNNA